MVEPGAPWHAAGHSSRRAGRDAALGQERFDASEVKRQHQGGEERDGCDDSFAHRGAVIAA